MENRSEKFIIHLDRLEYNFDVAWNEYYDKTILPISYYRLDEYQIIKFDTGFWLVYKPSVSYGTSFYLGFEVYFNGHLFGKLLMHEKRQKKLARLCLFKNILYTQSSSDWLKKIRQLQRTLHMSEKCVYYVEIALDTTKQVRKFISGTFQNSILNDECSDPYYKPVHSIIVNTLHNNQQYVLGSRDYNLCIYERGKNLDSLFTGFFLENGFEENELASINRAELRLHRKYLSQIKQKFNLSLEGLADQNNLTSIYLKKSQKFTLWEDIREHYFKNGNKKFKRFNLLDRLQISAVTEGTQVVKQEIRPFLYKRNESSDVIKRLLDRYLKTDEKEFLKLIKDSSKVYDVPSEELKKLITECFESVGQDVNESVWTIVLPSNYEKTIDKIKTKMNQCWKRLRQPVAP